MKKGVQYPHNVADLCIRLGMEIYVIFLVQIGRNGLQQNILCL